MTASKIKEGHYYWYKAAYGKAWQIYKCIKHYFNEPQNQWLGRFEVMTDTTYCNSIGTVERFNEIEMERYIDEIHDLEAAFKIFEIHQRAEW